MSITVNKEQKIQVVELIYKSIIGFIPGNHIINEVLEFRTKVQQSRLNKFSDYLKSGFENITGKSLDPENLKSECFIDVFETILKKVATTSNEEKIKRYRNVLLRTMYEKDNSEISFKYIDLIESLTDSQILILSGLYTHETFTNITIQYYIGNPNLYNSTEQMFIPEADDTSFMTANGYKFLFSELEFFLIDLSSKGLITKIKHPATKSMLNVPFDNERYNITLIGKGFVEFIKDYGKEG